MPPVLKCGHVLNGTFSTSTSKFISSKLFYTKFDVDEIAKMWFNLLSTLVFKIKKQEYTYKYKTKTGKTRKITNQTLNSICITNGVRFAAYSVNTAPAFYARAVKKKKVKISKKKISVMQK